MRIAIFGLIMRFYAIKAIKTVFPVVRKLRGVSVVPIVTVRQVNGHLRRTLGVNHVNRVR